MKAITTNDAKPSSATKATAMVAIKLRNEKEFYVTGDKISGYTSVQGLENTHTGSKIVVSLECNETCFLDDVGSESVLHFQRQITSIIPKRDVSGCKHNSFITPFDFILDDEIVGLPPTSSLESMGGKGIGIRWEVSTRVIRENKKEPETQQVLESVAVEVYPYVTGLRELVNEHGEGRFTTEAERFRVHWVDIPMWMPQVSQRFSGEIFVELKKPVYVRYISVSLEKTVDVALKGHKKTFHSEQEFLHINYDKMMVGRLCLSREIEDFQLEKRETGTFCSKYQHVHYDIRVDVRSMQLIMAKFLVKIIPPSISCKTTGGTNENGNTDELTKPPAYSDM